MRSQIRIRNRSHECAFKFGLSEGSVNAQSDFKANSDYNRCWKRFRMLVWNHYKDVIKDMTKDALMGANWVAIEDAIRDTI